MSIRLVGAAGDDPVDRFDDLGEEWRYCPRVKAMPIRDRNQGWSIASSEAQARGRSRQDTRHA
ncbi:hypothetical protein [Streptomyces olindensis]|uniref:hypothetical protein n=1 Tax=Streptomyces olindensis TaxID=358823 RepID=UPI0036610D0B